VSGSLRLRPRAEPLAPCAAAAEGAAAAALVRALLRRDDAALAGLSGVAAPGLLVVTGPAEALPWADGVRYLGRDPAAPALLLPTALEPEAPAALVERALLAAAGPADRVAAPFAVLDGPLRLVPLGEARPLDRSALLAWLERGA